MTYRIVDIDAPTWDAFVQNHPAAHLLQLSAWAQQQATLGWQAARITLEDAKGQICAGAQMLLKPLPLNLGTQAYIPYAPLVDWQDAAQVALLLDAIDQTARAHRAAFLKVEPGHGIEARWMQASGFRPSPVPVQPPKTIILDLADDETLLARMNQGTRRNIRKAAKSDVTIRQANAAEVRNFTDMLAETSTRQEFGIHSHAYYQRAYELFVQNGDGVLLLGSYNGQDLAGVFVFRVGQRAWYLYGASRHAERERRAPFGVQWAGIQWARDAGCTTYDLYGIPDAPDDTLESEFETRHDGLWGVYRFKRGWGGRTARTVGAWDRVYHPLIYHIYTLRHRLR